MMLIRRLLVLMAVSIAVHPAIAEPPNETSPQSLFDGDTLDGWEGDLTWFHVEDGAIVGGSMEDPISHNQFLCTKETYGDFELTLSVKTEGNANGGIQFRSKRVAGSTEVSGFQADVGWNFWGCLYDESRRNKTLVCIDEEQQNQLVKKGEWNDYRIRAEGNRIQLFLNGVKTVDYTEKDESIAREGIIGLQIHSGPPTRVWYKDLKIKALSTIDEG